MMGLGKPFSCIHETFKKNTGGHKGLYDDLEAGEMQRMLMQESRFGIEVATPTITFEAIGSPRPISLVCTSGSLNSVSRLFIAELRFLNIVIVLFEDLRVCTRGVITASVTTVVGDTRPALRRHGRLKVSSP
ncbi:hypothetical protein EVAR_80725_1 [Eumeta japonica]|uniref:Uncharacterized protein n=1 Tax=Eumeta variegata TaxID=151549 RepID=A0A4C1U4Z6_EUMVA|nr:hypothetical protein EVAR_80725_1 [Eumeta japonica]